MLDGVHHKGYDIVPATDNGLAPPSLWKLDIKASAANQIFVSGMGLESEWAHEHASSRHDAKSQGYWAKCAPSAAPIPSPAATSPSPTARHHLRRRRADRSADPADRRGQCQRHHRPDQGFGLGAASRYRLHLDPRPAAGRGAVAHSFRRKRRQYFGDRSAATGLAVNGLSGRHGLSQSARAPCVLPPASTGCRVVGADATTGRGTSLAAGK